MEIIRVGRNPDSELCLEDLGVSFDHAEMRFRNGAFWLVDRGSTNGSYLNGERAFNSKIREGDILKFGKRGPEIRFRLRQPRVSSGRLDAVSAGKNEVVKVKSPKPAKSPNHKPTHKNVERVAPKVVVSPGANGLGSQSSVASDSGNQRIMNAPLPPSLIAADEAVSKTSFRVLLALFIMSLLLLSFLVFQLLDADDRLVSSQNQLSKLRQDVHKRQKLADELQDNLNRRNRELENSKDLVKDLRRKNNLKETEYRRENQIWERSKRDYVNQISDYRDEVKRLRQQIDMLGRSSNNKGGWAVPDRVVFQRIQKRFNSSVVLVFTQLIGRDKKGKVVNLSCSGTGFILNRQGYVVTNKHVIQPWKFSRMAKRIAQEGIEIDPNSHHISVWVAGTRYLFKNTRRLDYSTGFSTRAKNLSIHRVAPDELQTMKINDGRGPRNLKVHAMRSNADVAVLKILEKGPFNPVVPHGDNDLPIEKLDPVMVLGFPLGVSILESSIAETSPNIGTVRKVENSIWISASMHQGNSGGPVFDRAGRVIGISTRIVGSENLGACIKIKHALNLIGGKW